MDHRIKSAILALCNDERQEGYEDAYVELSYPEYKKEDRRMKMEGGLTVIFARRYATPRKKIRITVGNLYMDIPTDPDNIQRFAEMTGKWPVKGWWKTRDPFCEKR